ncbi:MAG: radical SAM protein [Dehalococcoides mccartyi]|uniref:radical SAM protein n=1 Tax=Dehalococcoides mccartyi TaxID=61435 RepID=UPI0025C8BE12|nr:radical SAM protein [Dehalococcoides mccartyi]MDN4186736.1 radical SAM protein [Dehalococcoides mccartyi]
MTANSHTPRIMPDRQANPDMTNVYHIAYAPGIKKAYLFHWNCNLKCRGCLCKKEINCLALEENLDVVARDPHLAPPRGPESFLSLNGIMETLRKVELKEVLFEGQEATIDPHFAEICRRLKAEFGVYITLNTNGLKLPDLSNVDEVVFSLKAVTPELYLDYTEVPNTRMLENFENIFRSGKKLRAEMVFIPGYIDIAETEVIAKHIASLSRDIPLRIDAYFECGNNTWRRATPEEMRQAVAAAKKHLNTVTCTQQTTDNLDKKDLFFEVKRLF